MRHCPASRLLVFGLLMLSVSLFAQPKPSYPNYTAHINDFANVVDPNTKSQLETILTNFEKLTGTQIAVVTMTTIGERPLEDYANGLYRAWGIGAKSGATRDKGALLLVLTQDRRSRLEVGYGLEGDLPDGLAGEQLRRMRPYFQQQQWSQGLQIGTRTLVDTLAAKWNVNVEGIDRSFAYQPAAQVNPPSLQLSTRSLIFLGFGFLVLLFIMVRLSKRAAQADQLRRRDSGWWAAPMVFHQGGGGYGGSSWGSDGGWGGGSSSGGGASWGGFGGGSSGGGGASDSW